MPLRYLRCLIPVVTSKRRAHGFTDYFTQFRGSYLYYGERLNSISHLVGAALALIGMGALATVGIQIGDP